MKKIIRAVIGYCYCCKRKTMFISNDYWLRDYYRCIRCQSIPRQRALMKVLQNESPDYQKLRIHESSPSGATFERLKSECKQYTYSYFYKNKQLGCAISKNGTNQNLEKLTFGNETFDIFITQDVMEHVNDPIKAFAEISRVLKPGGVHIFTTPIYSFQKTRPRVDVIDGKRVNILPPVYHNNPIDKKGSLVTYDWGNDICEFIEESCGMKSVIIEFPNREENYKSGLEADFLQVILSRK